MNFNNIFNNKQNKEIEKLKIDILYLNTKIKQLEDDKKQLQISYCFSLDYNNKQ